MAIDAWLFGQHCQGTHPPTLRFYTWEPAAISLGYHQRQYPAHWQNVRWQNHPIALVRRPTGGRAVLHQGDLTYAVVMSGLDGKRMQGYRQICQFLIQGWRSLGVELAYGEAGRGYIQNPNCFGSATAADLVLPDGAKLIGSAQQRRGSCVLQHGSMRLTQDATLFQQVFGVSPHLPKLPLASEGDGLIQTVIGALTDAAVSHFGMALQIQPLSDEEWPQIYRHLPLEC
jgi:lipoate-protein ligase A